MRDAHLTRVSRLLVVAMGLVLPLHFADHDISQAAGATASICGLAAVVAALARSPGVKMRWRLPVAALGLFVLHVLLIH